MKLSMTSWLFGGIAWVTLSLAGAVSAQQAELVVGSFGGAYDEALAEVTKIFEAENNVKVTLLPGGANASMPRARNGEIDMTVIGMTDLMRLQAEGLLAPLDPLIVTNIDKLYPQALISDYGVVANFGARAMAYNTDHVTDVPTSWEEMADPKYKGRVILRPFTVESADLIVMLARNAGGDERNPDAGFAKMAEIAANVGVWEGEHAGILELFRSDEADFAVWSDGRILWAAEEGAPVAGTIPKEGFSPLASSIAIVKTTKNMELAQKYANFMLDDAAGIKLATDLHYFPSKVDTVLPEGVTTGFLDADTIGSLVMNDWAYIVTVYGEWEERFNKEVVQ
ncbi:extracellular solute-binding protein [Pseudogemmobacter sonorensis]|uniref:extracellular solute-binding protein n=1 Tax=Pseudogemmobacter sonorensis TaxID=2989681 RepID=UPI00368B811A